MKNNLDTNDLGVSRQKKAGRAIRFNLFCPKKGKKGFPLLSLTQKNPCHE
tara:strand:+ start:1306 stop:1455 length:150 start_codon:yes stop_codon:yes gene_type:complete